MKVVGHHITQIDSNQFDYIQYTTKGLLSYKFFGCIEEPEIYVKSILKVISKLDSIFQSSLRKVTFFLCNSEYLKRFSGEKNTSGLAYQNSHSILLTVHHDIQRFEELVCHELVHLYTLDWNRSPSRALEEGIAMYLQRTSYDKCIDNIAKIYARSNSKPVYLLSDEEFDGHHRDDKLTYANYCLSGSFTKFLISCRLRVEK